ncbi:hypothetical protein TRVL_09201 [Trypanosoma vivax]|nr:hypothetical protein TRVL_09201 [Trypanosoma vivax]
MAQFRPVTLMRTLWKLMERIVVLHARDKICENLRAQRFVPTATPPTLGAPTHVTSEVRWRNGGDRPKRHTLTRREPSIQSTMLALLMHWCPLVWKRVRWLGSTGPCMNARRK